MPWSGLEPFMRSLTTTVALGYKGGLFRNLSKLVPRCVPSLTPLLEKFAPRGSNVVSSGTNNATSRACAGQ